MKKETRNIRTDALPQDGKTWADALWEGTDLTHEALRIQDIIPSTDKACNKALRDCVIDLVDAGRIMIGSLRNNTDSVDVERDLESIRSRHNKRTAGK